MDDIFVTKTFLPSIEEYLDILRVPWSNHRLTNRGALVRKLESNLIDYLGVANLTLTANGTLPLQIAIKALDLKDEVITTPFSYIATTSCLIWESCKPVYVDIDPVTWNIDPSLIEAAITPQTTGILVTHVFGNPCNVETIETIAQKNNLKVIYDAAHCFGVEYDGQSIFNYGDVSSCSLHATKLYHTGEGGFWCTKSSPLQKRMFALHNFGHDGPGNFSEVGINAKMSELNAALGLALFEYLDVIISKRKAVVESYNSLLLNLDVQTIRISEKTKWNYSYYPVVFETESLLLEIIDKMNRKNIYPRRYFYPSLHNLSFVDSQEMPVSSTISERILCIPLSPSLEEKEIHLIVDCIKSVLNR